MILAIDSGNTRTKWAVFNAHDDLVAQGVLHNRDLHRDEAWQNCPWHLCQKAIISNVAGNVVEQMIMSRLHAMQVSARWIKPTPHACGVRNGYQSPSTLGADRWAALIGAWHCVKSACLVVNVGTAMTVDALVPVASTASDDAQESEFLGGLIMPGLAMLQHALWQGTAGIQAQQGDWQTFPQSTADAVHTGAVNALVGAVCQMAKQLSYKVQAPIALVMSGGDATWLAHQMMQAQQQNDWIGHDGLVSNPRVIENLVLSGLLLLERHPE